MAQATVTTRDFDTLTIERQSAVAVNTCDAYVWKHSTCRDGAHSVVCCARAIYRITPLDNGIHGLYTVKDSHIVFALAQRIDAVQEKTK